MIKILSFHPGCVNDCLGRLLFVSEWQAIRLSLTKNGEACEKVYLLFSENKKNPFFFSSFETTFAHLLSTAVIPYLIKSIHSSVVLVCILCPRFKTFEEYLDSLVIEDDQKFLKDVDTARVIAQLGYRLENS